MLLILFKTITDALQYFRVSQDVIVRTRLADSEWLSICSASSSQACRAATLLLYFSQLQITSSNMLRTLRTSSARFFH